MNPPLSQRHSAPADRNQAIMDHDQMAPDVHAPHQSGHLPVTQVMYFYYTSIGLNPPMTSIKNWQCHQIMAFYIYINHCHRVQADYLPHGPWMVPDRLTCWVFEDVMEVHQEHLINLLWPSPTDALGPNIMPAVTLSLLMASAPLWTDTEGPLTAFQLISGPSSSLTHDNLVSKPRGEDTQRKCFPWQMAFFSSFCCCWNKCLSYCTCQQEIHYIHPIFLCIFLSGPYLRFWQGVNVQENNRVVTVNLGPTWLHSFPDETQMWITARTTHILSSLHLPPYSLFQPINP